MQKKINHPKNAVINQNITPKRIAIALLVIISFFVIRKFSIIILTIFFSILIFALQKSTTIFKPLAYLGVEAGYFSTIYMGYLFGPKAGIYFGLAFLALHILHISQWTLNPFDVLIKLIMIPGIGFLGSLFSAGSIILPGTIIVAFVSIIIFIVDQFTVRSPIHEMVIWCITLVIFNNILFTVLGGVIKLLVV